MTRYRLPRYRVRLMRDRTVAYRADSPPAAAAVLRQVCCAERGDREVMAVVYLGPACQLLGVEVVGIGGSHALAVTAADVLRGAILAGASSIVLGHCHPSGDCRPSAADWTMTASLAGAADAVSAPRRRPRSFVTARVEQSLPAALPCRITLGECVPVGVAEMDVPEMTIAVAVEIPADDETSRHGDEGNQVAGIVLDFEHQCAAILLVVSAEATAVGARLSSLERRHDDLGALLVLSDKIEERVHRRAQPSRNGTRNVGAAALRTLPNHPLLDGADNEVRDGTVIGGRSLLECALQVFVDSDGERRRVRHVRHC
jgi:RadC-like JAB domain-containing protein